jgi:hypothetical protein
VVKALRLEALTLAADESAAKRIYAVQSLKKRLTLRISCIISIFVRDIQEYVKVRACQAFSLADDEAFDAFKRSDL